MATELPGLEPFERERIEYRPQIEYHKPFEFQPGPDPVLEESVPVSPVRVAMAYPISSALVEVRSALQTADRLYAFLRGQVSEASAALWEAEALDSERAVQAMRQAIASGSVAEVLFPDVVHARRQLQAIEAELNGHAQAMGYRPDQLADDEAGYLQWWAKLEEEALVAPVKLRQAMEDLALVSRLSPEEAERLASLQAQGAQAAQQARQLRANPTYAVVQLRTLQVDQFRRVLQGMEDLLGDGTHQAIVADVRQIAQALREMLPSAQWLQDLERLVAGLEVMMGILRLRLDDVAMQLLLLVLSPVHRALDEVLRQLVEWRKGAFWDVYDVLVRMAGYDPVGLTLNRVLEELSRLVTQSERKLRELLLDGLRSTFMWRQHMEAKLAAMRRLETVRRAAEMLKAIRQLVDRLQTAWNEAQDLETLLAEAAKRVKTPPAYNK